jgi:hypothetical protein
MGKHSHHRHDDLEDVRSLGPCGILGGLFGGDSNLLLIILIAVFLLCFCNKGIGLGALGDTPVRLVESFLKSKSSPAPAHT